jgi:sensitive to high expression protein 9
MSTLGTASTSLSTVSRCGQTILRVRKGTTSGIARIHTGRPSRQDPKLKDNDNELWAMPSPSSEAGPSRQPANVPSDQLETLTSSTSTPSAPPASSPVGAPTSSPSSSGSSSRLKFQDRLPKWIPPHWQTHLQPDAQWRKELLSRRKKLAEQAGQQLTGLGLKLNEVTGYKEVERLKELVEEKGESLSVKLMGY